MASPAESMIELRRDAAMTVVCQGLLLPKFESLAGVEQVPGITGYVAAGGAYVGEQVGEQVEHWTVALRTGWLQTRKGIIQEVGLMREALHGQLVHQQISLSSHRRTRPRVSQRQPNSDFAQLGAEYALSMHAARCENEDVAVCAKQAAGAIAGKALLIFVMRRTRDLQRYRSVMETEGRNL